MVQQSEKSYPLRVNLDTDNVKMVEDLKTFYNIQSLSDLIRFMIKKNHDEIKKDVKKEGDPKVE